MAPKPLVNVEHSKVSARAQQARSVCAPSITPRPKKEKVPKVIARASSAAGKAARRTRSVQPRRRPARVSGNSLRSSEKEWPRLHGAWCMRRAHAARAKQAASCTITFSKGDRGDCLGINMPKLPKHAQPVRVAIENGGEFCAWREGQGIRLPSAGRQPTRQLVRVRHTLCRASSGAPRRLSVAAKRLFLSPSAFFEPAKKVRKNGKRQRPIAVSRDTEKPKKLRASNASRVSLQNETASYRPLVYPAVGRGDLPCAASLSRRSSVIPRGSAGVRATQTAPPSKRRWPTASPFSA